MCFAVFTTSIHDNVPPPIFLPGASDITVRQGDVAVLPCAVKHLGTKQVDTNCSSRVFPTSFAISVSLGLLAVSQFLSLLVA